MSYETTQSELESLFSEVGQVVEVFLPDDHNTGRPRGFAFVEFTEESTVAEAIDRFDEHELNGRALRVNEAESKQPRTSHFSDAGRSGTYQGSRGSKPKGSRRNLRAKKRGF